jgi:hypothetical protein
MTTTRKPYHGKDGPVTFGRPTIGPRVYLVKGPSGWSETYERKLADAALTKFVSPLDVVEICDALLTAIQLEKCEETWHDILDYLAKLTQQNAKTIPEIVVVALWAKMILHEETKEMN